MAHKVGNELLENIEKLHTSELGVERILRNLSLGKETQVVEWCKEKIREPDAVIFVKGKNWYIKNRDAMITVNTNSYTIITAHKVKY